MPEMPKQRWRIELGRTLQHSKIFVDDVQWFPVKEGNLVRFKQDSTACRVFYDSRGRWVYTVKWYGEKEMPKRVRALIKSTWYDYTITQVDEVHQGFDPIVYIVHMQDGASWKNVHVCNLEIRNIEEYVKAP